MSINAEWNGDPRSTTGGPGEGPDQSPAAARLLEKTAHDTDRWRSEARSEAAAIVAGARKEAAELVQAAREQSERLVTAARDEAAQATNDARVEAYRVRQETTALRRRHDEDIARLQQVATEHREQLRDHLTQMLERVDSAPGESRP